MKRLFAFHSVLFLFVFVTGLFLVFAPPPFQKADEYAHFRRSLMLSRGILWCTPQQTMSVRTDIYALFQNHLFNRMTYDKTAKINFHNMIGRAVNDRPQQSVKKIGVADLCTYPFVSYVPQSISLFFIERLSANAFVLFYIGRLSVFLFCFSTMLYLFKKTPKPFHYVILFVFSLPMTLYQMTSYSYDALQIIFLLTFFSYLVQIMATKQIRTLQIVVLNIIFFLFLLAKPGGYEFLILTLFIVPRNRRQLISLAGISIIFTAFYFLLRVSLYQHVAGMSFQNGINPSVQVGYLFNPVSDLLLILRTSVHYAWFYYKGLVGIFGWLEYGLNGFSYLLYAFVALLILNMKHTISLNRFQKVILIASICITYCFLIGINYLFWTKPGALITDGVQGRYFIPIVPFLFLLGYSFLKKPFLRFQNKPRLIKLLTIFFAFYIFISIVIAVLNRYYS